MTEKRALQLDDLLAVEYLSSPALSPDGETALYVVSRTNREDGTFSPAIWRVPASGGTAAPLLQEGFCQKLPRFSPDGETIYFLSDEQSPGIFQVWQLQGGQRRQLTGLRHGVSWFSLSQNGDRLAFEAPLWMEGTATGDCRENALQPLPPEERAAWRQARERQPIVIEELAYKFDETYGIPDGSFQQIGIVELPSGETRLLSWEPVHHRRHQ